MRGFAGCLFDVLLPALFLSFFGFAIGVGIPRDFRRRFQWPKGFPASSVPMPIPIRRFTLAAVFFCTIMTVFIVYREVGIHYDLWKLDSRNVEAVNVGGREFTDQSSIAQIVAALKASEWYSVDHGGWGDQTSIVMKMASGEKWQMMAGYHFAQHGAVILRSSGSNGSGWQLGQVFSPALPNVLEQLGVPLSHCDTAHEHPCQSLQGPRH